MSNKEQTMSAVPQIYLTPADYLAFERQSEIKHEYFRGEIFALAGASQNHVTILMNTSYLLVGQLKGRQYRTLDTLTNYLLISQEKPHIEHFARQADGGWLLTESGGMDAVMPIESIQCQLPLAEVYDRVEFDQTPPLM
jgi:hypothetical protein